MARIFVDTNVLFPFSVMDLMLALSEDAIHHVLWTDELLDEWERVIVAYSAARQPGDRTGTARSASGVTRVVRVISDAREQ